MTTRISNAAAGSRSASRFASAVAAESHLKEQCRLRRGGQRTQLRGRRATRCGGTLMRNAIHEHKAPQQPQPPQPQDCRDCAASIAVGGLPVERRTERPPHRYRRRRRAGHRAAGGTDGAAGTAGGKRSVRSIICIGGVRLGFSHLITELAPHTLRGNTTSVSTRTLTCGVGVFRCRWI